MLRAIAPTSKSTSTRATASPARSRSTRWDFSPAGATRACGRSVVGSVPLSPLRAGDGGLLKAYHHVVIRSLWRGL